MQHRYDVWAKKFQDLLDRFPGGYWLFAADNCIYLMRYNTFGERVFRDDGLADPNYIVEQFRFRKADGGYIMGPLEEEEEVAS